MMDILDKLKLALESNQMEGLGKDRIIPVDWIGETIKEIEYLRYYVEIIDALDEFEKEMNEGFQRTHRELLYLSGEMKRIGQKAKKKN